VIAAISSTDARLKIRADFPLLADTSFEKKTVYLDNAATSLKPQCVVDAITEYYCHVSANIHRGKHMLSETASSEFERARGVVAEMIGAEAHQVAFTANTTAALNTVANGLALRSDDLVLVPLDTHHSNLLPWRRHARVKVIRPDPTGALDLDHYASLLKERPRVVAATHCSNVTGHYAPLSQMAAMAKEAGAVFVVDAAQSVPHRRLVLPGSNIDFLAFSAHKMLGPTGIGILYGSGERLRELAPLCLGGGTVDWVDSDTFVLRDSPHRHEAGTPHVAGAFGLAAAVDYLGKLGWDTVEQHDALMAAALLDEATHRPWLRVVGGLAASDRAAIVSFGIVGQSDLGDVARSLSDSYGVMARTGHLCAQPLVDHFLRGDQLLRFSGYVYNTVDEVRFAFAALDEVASVSGLIET
jgi:cysteine desulfurase/selenocysteine lyase